MGFPCGEAWKAQGTGTAPRGGCLLPPMFSPGALPVYSSLDPKGNILASFHPAEQGQWYEHALWGARAWVPSLLAMGLGQVVKAL